MLKKILITTATLAAGVFALPALADRGDHRGNGHGHWKHHAKHHGHHGHYVAPRVVVVPRPVYVQPAPVYYRPAPVYHYAPPAPAHFYPAYPAPASGVSIRFNFPL